MISIGWATRTLLVMVVAVELGGCSAIRVVRASKSGGEIALLGDREKAMEKARVEMAATCGGPETYDILEEGEAVIGTHSTTQEQTVRNRTWYGAPSTQTAATSDTTEKTEWRVKYTCKGAAQPAPTGPAPAPAPLPGTPSARNEVHEVVVVF